MLTKVVFWGAAGHAKVLREFIGRAGYELVALFDNNPEVQSPFPDVPIYYGEEGFKRWKQEQPDTEEIAGLVTIAGARGRVRLRTQRFLELNHIRPITVIHPTAFVAAEVTIPKGCHILANSAVCADVEMGEACILNTGAIVDHDAVLGDGVHVTSGASVGVSSIGDYTMIGQGAVVMSRVKVGRDVIVGAGAVVTKDIPDGKVVAGVPAKIWHDNVVSDFMDWRGFTPRVQ